MTTQLPCTSRSYLQELAGGTAAASRFRFCYGVASSIAADTAASTPGYLPRLAGGTIPFMRRYSTICP